MLETWNLVRKYIYKSSLRKCTFQNQEPLNYTNVSICFRKNSVFFVKKVHLLKAIILSFSKMKGTINKSVNFSDYASGIVLPYYSKLALTEKNDNEVTIFRHDVIINFFEVQVFLLSSLATISSFMSLSLSVLEL